MFPVDEVAAHVMDVHAEPMRGPVHVEALVLLLFDERVHVARQQAEIDEALRDHLHGALVDRLECDARLHGGDGGHLSAKHDFVDRSLLIREAPVDREGARDVARVVPVLATGVDQHELAVVHDAVACAIVQDGRVRSRAHDAVVRRSLAPVLAVDVNQLRIDLVFTHAGPRELHRAKVRLRRDRGRLPHRVELGRALAKPHLVQVDGRVDDRFGRGDASAAAASEGVQTLEQLGIGLVVLGEPIVKALHVSEVVGEAFFELLDGEGRVGSERFDCTFDTRTGTVPNLALALLRPNEEDGFVLVVLVRQQQHALRLVEAGEVVEIAVLPVGVLDVVVADGEGCRGEKSHAVTHGFEKLLPACCKLRHAPRA